VVPVRVVPSIGLLNVAVGCTPSRTLVARLSGAVRVTMGGIASAPVVKVQVWATASRLPARSVTRVVTTTV
jgi:hypothetical protein